MGAWNSLVKKLGVGAYTDKPSVHETFTHANRRIIKNVGWALAWSGHLHGGGHLLGTQ